MDGRHPDSREGPGHRTRPTGQPVRTPTRFLAGQHLTNTLSAVDATVTNTVTVRLGDLPSEVRIGPGQGRSLFVGPNPPAELPGIRVDPAAELDWRALDALESLTEVHYTGDDGALVAYLAARPGVTSLSWEPVTRTTIDLTATSLARVVITNTGSVESVALPGSTHFLSLVGVVAGLDVSTLRSADAEPFLTCQFSRVGSVEPIRGLADGAPLVTVWQCGALDLGALEPHVGMRELHVVETPVRGLAALTALPELRSLWLQDCYDLDLSGLPSPQGLAKLELLRLDGVRATDADVVRARWDTRPRVTVQRARSSAWLLKNHGNPFREWADDGSDSHTAKGATAAWRKALTALEKAAPSDGEAASAVLAQFVEAFNRLHERDNCIDTIRSEEVAHAFDQLTTRHPALARAHPEAIFERLRRF